MAGGEAAPGSRALLPMTPEEENMIRTIAVLQFDSEDNLVLVADGERPGSESYYYFRNLTEDEDTPNGDPGRLNWTTCGCSPATGRGRRSA